MTPNATSSTTDPPDERLRRWRLVLGGDQADGTGVTLGGADASIDAALRALYDADRDRGLGGKSRDRRGGLGASVPNVARWLGDIRTYFPSSIVRIMQQDALERLDLKEVLREAEVLARVEPDVQLVAHL